MDGRRLDEEWNRGKPVEQEFQVKKLMVSVVSKSHNTEEIDWLLDSIIQEAETIKLFSEKNDDAGSDIKERCVDMIQKNVRHLTFYIKETNEDSAFFAGELDDDLGERNVFYPERFDADDDVQWITVNGNHIPVDENGEPLGGQEKAFGGENKGSALKNAEEKIKNSDYPFFGIKIADDELEDGAPHIGDMDYVGKYVGGKKNTVRMPVDDKSKVDADFLKDQLQQVLYEHGEQLNGKNVYLVGADRGIPQRGEVLCKLLERGGEEEKELMKGMPVDENKSEKRYGDKRKQVPVPWTGIPEYQDDRIKKFNEKALESIIEETGMGKEEAEKFQQSLIDYFGGNYLAYADGKKQDDVKKIDDGLSRMGAYDGEIWRGMRFRDDAPEGAPDSGGIEQFKNLKIGDEIGMKSLSSWTSDERVARQFADLTDSSGTNPVNSVVICCTKNKTSVGLQHVSKFRREEAEVLAKSTTKWKVAGKKILSVYDYLSEKEKGWKDKIERFPEFKERAKNHFVVFLEVEEI